MVNSLMVAMEFDRLLPEKSRPEYTEGYEGFNHLNDMNGGVNETHMNYIIRNHDFNLFEQQKTDFVNAMNYLNNKYGYQVVELEIVDSYRNMKELILPHKEILDYPINALKFFNLQPVMEPIRGGTDGARLSYEGVLCPNLGTGSYNHHGPMEIADITDMTKMVDIICHMLTTIK
jgi:tripeptide aminopeptidase